jgi:hypothetical protein|tara:strand:- start:1407 stop:1547 length:141 start_codon:yes stop_codon:yes gene_type:complete
MVKVAPMKQNSPMHLSQPRAALKLAPKVTKKESPATLKEFKQIKNN